MGWLGRPLGYASEEIIKMALAGQDGRLQLTKADEHLMDELKRNRFNTERAIEIYTIAVDNSVWAFVKKKALRRLIYRDYRRSGWGKRHAIELTDQFKVKFHPPLADQRPPRRFLRYVLGA
jgi:hypothetical protein